ncbi:hypothetical protein [Abyssibius alkaniclasticus]|uniref:hypothetical protein n=1 Tax=Abyssibius alkaniclasticus TaxID=2881234 RepID=UPI00405A28D5
MRIRLALLFSLCATALTAEGPSSAIDWLSNAIENPPRYYIPPPTQSRLPADDIVRVTPLENLDRESVGLIASSLAGFSPDMWGDASAEDAIARINGFRPSTLPEANALFRRLVLAQANPPLGADASTSVLLARVDQLFAMGALDEAETLIVLANPDETELFRRWFEISLLVGRTVAPCEALRKTPGLAEDLSIRAICLARAGDWNAAATSVSLGAALGELSDSRADLMIRFLDPALFEDDDNPPFPVPMTPIDFALRESLALPRPLGRIAPPYLFVDLALSTPLRQRMDAAERLVETAAITPPLLFAIYRGGRPAASGGIWGRAAAVQALDAALAEDDDTVLALAMKRAFTAFAEPSLMTALAYEFAPQLAMRPPSAPLEPVAENIQRLLLLAGADAPLWYEQMAQDDTALELARRIYVGNEMRAESAPNAPLMRAVHAAFTGRTPQHARTDAARALLQSGQQAPAVLMALDLLAKGADTGPADIELGLWLLRQAGQEIPARRLAVQLLLLERAGA